MSDAERQELNKRMAEEEAERQRVNQAMAEYWGIA
jgi:hypothetical protein